MELSRFLLYSGLSFAVNVAGDHVVFKHFQDEIKQRVFSEELHPFVLS